MPTLHTDPERRLLIAIATYNERENLPSLVDDLLATVPYAHLLIVDDQSPDGTGVWCDERSAYEPRLACLHRPGKLGLGTATIAGLRYALDEQYETVVTMDADYSHDPRYLPTMLERLRQSGPSEVDVVVASRYIAGGGVQGWPWRRRVMSRLINAFARWWLAIRVHDTSGSYRAYRTAILRRLVLSDVKSHGYSVFQELLWRLTRANARFAEVPITFIDRHRGHSKITLREACRSVWQIVRLTD